MNLLESRDKFFSQYLIFPAKYFYEYEKLSSITREIWLIGLQKTKGESVEAKIENGENRLGVTSHLFAPTFAQNTLERRRWTSAKPRSVFFVLPAAQQTLCVCVRIASECNRTRNEPFLLHIPEKARRRDFSSIITNLPCPCNYFFPPLLPFVSFLPPLSISIRGGDSYFLLSSYSIDNW